MFEYDRTSEQNLNPRDRDTQLGQKMTSLKSVYDNVGIPWPDRSAYKNRIDSTLHQTDLALPDVLLIIIVDYATSFMIKFTSTYYQDTINVIYDKADTVVLLPKLPMRYRPFAGIQIHAAVLTKTDGWVDLLSDHTWHKRYKHSRAIKKCFITLPKDAYLPTLIPEFRGVMHDSYRYSASLGFNPQVF